MMILMCVLHVYVSVYNRTLILKENPQVQSQSSGATQDGQVCAQASLLFAHFFPAPAEF